MTKRLTKQYTDEDIINAVKNSNNWKEALALINLQPTWSSKERIKSHVDRLGISTDHWSFGFRKNPYRSYTDEDIIKNAALVYNKSDLLRALGLKCAGGNHVTIQNSLDRLGVDTSHWLKNRSNSGRYFKEPKDYVKNDGIKKRIINDRGHKCEGPCQGTEWYGYKIPLELHHIDGNNKNNEIDNLQLLCINCHYLTPNYRRRKTPLKPL